MNLNICLLFFISVFLNFQSECQVFTDIRDNHVYKIVNVGTQVWFAENINFKTDSGSWCYENKIMNCEKFGRLYNWKTANKICPDGWHLPSDNEWKILSDNLGNESAVEGKIQKKNDTYRGDIPNVDFYKSKDNSILPGTCFWNGTGFLVSNHGYWWTSTNFDSVRAWHRALLYSESQVFFNISNKENGYSVRCIKNN